MDSMRSLPMMLISEVLLTTRIGYFCGTGRDSRFLLASLPRNDNTVFSAE